MDSGNLLQVYLWRILDQHPALRLGWFEGGIAWVPWALQDAEHLMGSYQHMFNRPLDHDVRYYWDNHMSASFMVDRWACS